MTRSLWLRILAVSSALALVAAGCGAEETDDAPEAAAVDEAEAAPDDAETTPDEAETTPDEAVAEDDEPAEPGQVTAYVVGYHWGWALFDEDGTEIEVLEVPVGTEVELIAVNDHATHAIDQLPSPVAEAIRGISWHERAHHAYEAGRLPGLDAELEQVGMDLSEALAAAHDGHDHMAPAQDHGLMVTGIGVEVFLDAHGDEPQQLVFTVEDEGTHEFRCTEDCGVGHEAQRWEMLVVSA